MALRLRAGGSDGRCARSCFVGFALACRGQAPLVAAAFGQAAQQRCLGRTGLHDELGVALRARFRDRLLPDAEVAFNRLFAVVRAAVERPPRLLAADLDDFTATLRTVDTQR